MRMGAIGQKLGEDIFLLLVCCMATFADELLGYALQKTLLVIL